MNIRVGVGPEGLVRHCPSRCCCGLGRRRWSRYRQALLRPHAEPTCTCIHCRGNPRLNPCLCGSGAHGWTSSASDDILFETANSSKYTNELEKDQCWIGCSHPCDFGCHGNRANFGEPVRCGFVSSRNAKRSGEPRPAQPGRPA